MDVFDLAAKITLDSSGYEQELNRVAGVTSTIAGKIGDAFKTAATVTGAVLTGTATAFGALTKSALDSTGELEQGLGGSVAVFRDYASVIQSAASGAYENMGLSANQFMSTANKMGALLKGSGFEIADAADLTAQAMQRAADVASIMGIDVTWAMDSIAGAAKGNFTMMDNLGVAMNETTLNAYALEIGLKKTTKEMTNQEKVGLALEMFLDRTAYATGNYAKENGTLVGSITTLKAAWDNFLSGAGNGEQLGEAFGNFFEIALAKVQEVTPRLVKGLERAFESVTGIDLTPILDKIGQLQGLFADLGAAFQEGGISGVLEELFQILEDATGIDLTPILDKIGQFVTDLQGLFADLGAAFQEGGISGALDELFQILEDATGIDLSPIADGIDNFVKNFTSSSADSLKKFAESVDKLFDDFSDSSFADGINNVVEKLGEFLDLVGEIAGGTFSDIVDAIGTLVDDFDRWAPLIAGVVTALATFAAGLAALSIINTVKTAVSGLQIAFAALNAVMNANPILLVISLITGLVTALIVAWNTNDQFREGCLSAWETIKSAAQQLADTVVKFFTETIPNAISDAVDAIENKVEDFKDAGKNLFGGLSDGISSMINTVVETAKGAANKVISAVKKVFGIKSPSKVFREIGNFLVIGLKEGWEDNIGSVIGDIEKSLDMGKMTAHASVDFASSAVGKSSSATVNGIMAASSQLSGGSYNINLVVDGRTLANVVFDPLNDVSKQRG